MYRKKGWKTFIFLESSTEFNKCVFLLRYPRSDFEKLFSGFLLLVQLIFWDLERRGWTRSESIVPFKFIFFCSWLCDRYTRWQQSLALQHVPTVGVSCTMRLSQ